MLTIIGILKTLIEIAGLALIGQGILYLLSGSNREQNLFYRILSTITAPVWKFTRLVMPRVIVNQHIGYVAFLLLAIVWYFLLVAQAGRCLSELGHSSCERLAIEYVKRCQAGQSEACLILERNKTEAPSP